MFGRRLLLNTKLTQQRNQCESVVWNAAVCSMSLPECDEGEEDAADQNREKRKDVRQQDREAEEERGDEEEEKKEKEAEGNERGEK